MALVNTTEQKTKVSVGLPNRMVEILTAESKRRGISFGDQLRRALDEWHDTRGQVKILDRADGRVMTAR